MSMDGFLRLPGGDVLTLGSLGVESQGGTYIWIPSGKLTWQMENEPFEDVFPIENGEFSIISMLVYRSVDILNSIIPLKNEGNKHFLNGNESLSLRNTPKIAHTKNQRNSQSLWKDSGQISIIPKPELRLFWEDSPTKPPFKVTSAEVVILCPKRCVSSSHVV